MTLQQLTYFCAVARLLSFRRASEELLISQSTISISISNLETELGVPLFKREKRSIALTKYGRLYYEDVYKRQAARIRGSPTNGKIPAAAR